MTIYPNTIVPGFRIYHAGDFVHVGPNVKIGSNCTRVEVILDILYYWMWNDNSLTPKKRSKEGRLEDINFCINQCQYRIDAGAWDTIHPITQGPYSI